MLIKTTEKVYPQQVIQLCHCSWQGRSYHKEMANDCQINRNRQETPDQWILPYLHFQVICFLPSNFSTINVFEINSSTWSLNTYHYPSLYQMPQVNTSYRARSVDQHTLAVNLANAGALCKYYGNSSYPSKIKQIFSPRVVCISSETPSSIGL